MDSSGPLNVHDSKQKFCKVMLFAFMFAKQPKRNVVPSRQKVWPGSAG